MLPSHHQEGYHWNWAALLSGPYLKQRGRSLFASQPVVTMGSPGKEAWPSARWFLPRQALGDRGLTTFPGGGNRT